MIRPAIPAAGIACPIIDFTDPRPPDGEPSGGPNFHKFSDDVLYEIHLTRGARSLADVVSYTIEFRTSPLVQVDPTDLALPPDDRRGQQLEASFP